MSAPHFAQSYAEARTKFVAAASAEGLLVFAACDELPQAELTGYALEFDTPPVMQVLQAPAE